MRLSEKQTYVEANRFLGKLDKRLQLHDLNLTDNIDELKKFASEKASVCRKVIYANTPDEAFHTCKDIFANYQLKLPQDKTDAFLKKAACEKYWLLRIKKKSIQVMEDVRRLCGAVHKSGGIYCSNDGVSNWEHFQQLSKEFMEKTFLESEDGQLLSLAEIAKSNISNPANRRAEMMVRVRGFEEVAQVMGHVGEFYTITTPSRMHARHQDGKENEKHDGTTVSQAQEYLCELWSRIRAKLDRDDIKVYGVRVCEPHHDGTPHWHLLLFMHPDHTEQARNIISHYALETDGKEPGANKHRFKAEAIDSNKGDAASYISKYLAKNIDGEHLDDDLYGKSAKSSARRIRAWASSHKIRQFQFIGGPSVTLWRQLRKLKADCHDDLKPYFEAADAGDWAAYVLLMGGVNLPASARPLKL